jgi:hypothetical protein
MRKLALASLLLLAGCEMTSAMTGTTDDGEVFKGTATTNGSGTGGRLQLESSRGLTCVGRYTYSDPTTGRAIYNCSNGENGEATIANTGRGNGRGVGNIGGRRVIFILGGIS